MVLSRTTPTESAGHREQSLGQVLRPGTVTFSNENAAATSATFSDTGTYVLSLHSTDGQVKVFDQVTVDVVNPPMVQVQTMATPGTEFGATSGRFMISRNTGNFSTTVYYTLTGPPPTALTTSRCRRRSSLVPDNSARTSRSRLCSIPLRKATRP